MGTIISRGPCEGRAHRKHDVTFPWSADMKIAAGYFLLKNTNILPTVVINVIRKPSK